VEILGEDVSQLPLPPQRDELHRRDAKRRVVAAAALAQGMMEMLDVVQDVQLQRLGQQLVLPDDPAQPADGLSFQQRVEGRPLLPLIAQSQRLEQDGVRRLVLGFDERKEKTLDHGSVLVIGPWSVPA